MTKISKNIKNLRIEKGMTQSDLANVLYISRQAVSSWENGRTQPDVEMLGKLSQVFAVSVEELLYGKKYNTSIETEKDKPSYNSTLVIAFAILGSLLAGTGVILIFFTFWKELPMLAKGILSFLPLVLGQAAGIFALTKKRDKVHWCEGAGVLWSAGIAATLTMVYNIFSLTINWQDILILISLSILPVIFLLKSVSPLIIYYACGFVWGFDVIYRDSFLTKIIILILVTIGGIIFSLKLSKAEKRSRRSIYSLWISTGALLVLIMAIGAAENDALVLSGVCIMGIILSIISIKESELIMPYKIPGLIITSVATFMFSTGLALDVEKYKAYDIALFILYFALAIFAAVYTKINKADKVFMAYIITDLVSVIAYILCAVYSSDTDKAIILLLGINVVSYILLMIYGAKDKKLLPINIGFIFIALSTAVIVIASGLSMLTSGVLLLIFGVILLIINISLSRTKSKTKRENIALRQVETDEK